MADTNIISLNVRGLNNEEKRRNIFNWLSNLGVHIAFLQETFCKAEFRDQDNSGWRGKIIHNLSNSSHSRGVAVLFHEALQLEIHSVHKKDDARAILINATVENTNISFCNIYAPSKANVRKEFFTTMKYWIARHADFTDSIIMGGDMNCAINDNDRTGCNEDSSRATMKQMINQLKLKDAWYIKNDRLQYTFHDSSSNSKSRIDYLFISFDLEFRLKNISLKHAPKKDPHKGVYMGMVFKSNKRGPGYWKLNSRLLEEAQYIDLIKTTIKDCMKVDFNDARLLWEYIKVRVKAVSIKYGIERAKNLKKYVNDIQNEIDKLSADQDQGKI